MNENKWIDNSQITIMECVGANYNSSNGKMRWITITKTTTFVIFNLQNSHLLTFSFSTEKWTAKIGQWQIFQLSIFILSRKKCQHQSRNLRFLFLYIGFFPF